MDVGEWLKSLGLEHYEAAFRENGVSGEDLCHLTAEDLQDLGVIAVGHRRRLLVAIQALRLKSMPAGDLVPSSPGPSIDPSSQPEVSESTAERRPLSVMFCDLIGSTALSARLDPEDLREVIRTYQACVAHAIRPFNGFIARYVGDGVLIYFGWPQAHETDAESAVRAGLAIASAVGKTPACNEPLQVRIGIATGLVVIGEPIGAGDARQQTAVGETPNRAARLQSLAGPGQVVIDAATRRQVGNLFECRSLGTVDLKGLPAPVPAWQVAAENRTLGQFEALRSGVTPLVGRDEEMDLLLRRWAQRRVAVGLRWFALNPALANRGWQRRWLSRSPLRHTCRCAVSAHRTIRTVRCIPSSCKWSARQASRMGTSRQLGLPNCRGCWRLPDRRRKTWRSLQNCTGCPQQALRRCPISRHGVKRRRCLRRCCGKSRVWRGSSLC